MAFPDAPTLGDTGIPVSRLGLGLAALGRPGYINLGHAADLAGEYEVEAMRQRAFAVLDAALARGVRYFDAARSYGRAEPFLSAWLRERGLSSGDVTVGSKWGYTYTANWQAQAEQHEVKEHSLATFERQWPETRALLQPWLRLYMVHSVTLDSPVLHDEALQQRLLALRETGIAVGLSVSGARQAETLERALQLRVRGQELFQVVQATWNLLDPSAGAVLQQARARGWGVIIKEAVANGRLTIRGLEATPPALRKVSERLGIAPDVLALAGVLAQPFADVVLSGATSEAQLHSNLEALSVTLDEEALQELGNLQESPEAYWERRAQLPWT